MKKYMKVGLIALAAVTALSFGFTAIAAAQSTDGVVTDKEGPGQMFVGKLADILGLDEGQVSDAVQQARQEMREECQQQRLQNAIDEGLITDAEAEQIEEWWDSRPEAMQKLGAGGGFGHQMRDGLMLKHPCLR
jgi:hypothetical protein